MQHPDTAIHGQPYFLLHVFGVVRTNESLQVRQCAFSKPVHELRKGAFVTGLTPQHQKVEPQLPARAGPWLYIRSQLTPLYVPLLKTFGGEEKFNGVRKTASATKRGWGRPMTTNDDGGRWSYPPNATRLTSFNRPASSIRPS